MSRASRLHRVERDADLAVARHPAVRGLEPEHPEHGGRGAAVDERQDGNLQGGGLQPHQAGHQAQQAAFRSQLLPPPRLHLELRRFPPGPPAALKRRHRA